MKWNIFKRLEELEAAVELIKLQNDIAAMNLELLKKLEKSKPPTESEEQSLELKKELKKAKNQAYYYRNRERLLEARNNEEYKKRQRESSRKWYLKKLSEKNESAV